MRYLFPLCIIVLVFSQACTPKIRRWKTSSKEITSKELKVYKRANIFKDYGWTYPDLKSLEIAFNGKDYNFNMNGVSYTLSKTNEKEMVLTSGNNLIASSIVKKSKNDLYYNKKLLTLKAETRYRWVSSTYYVSRMVPVTSYRTVTTYQYDASSKSSRAVSTQQSYTTYQSHMTPQTTWHYQSYTEYVVDVPQYNYYWLEAGDSNTLAVYEHQGKYFLQNVSYKIAKDGDEIYYVLIDNNANGVYDDPNDEVLFNTWNPYLEKSHYKSSKYARENIWHSIDYLSTEEFLNISCRPSYLVLDYKNDQYAKGNSHGRVIFRNLPENAEVYVNGTKYKINESEDGYPSEYGIFNLRISRKGYLDFDTTYIINDAHKKETITYQKTLAGGVLFIKNIYSLDYYVTVTNANGYHKEYHKVNKITLPEGENTVEVYTEGSSIAKNFTAKAEETINYDFEAEIKSKLKEGKAEEKDKKPEEKEKK